MLLEESFIISLATDTSVFKSKTWLLVFLLYMSLINVLVLTFLDLSLLLVHRIIPQIGLDVQWGHEQATIAHILYDIEDYTILNFFFHRDLPFSKLQGISIQWYRHFIYR
jgi:hypothetical protein